jgi:hypothetical protein
MKRAVLVSAQLQLNHGVRVQYHDPLEISLDCPLCHRTRRTVVLRQADNTAICTPTKHAFPARIIARHISHDTSPELRLLVQYDYQPFVDTKYQSESTGIPSWGRVNFTCTCPNCGMLSTTSTQTNIVRPWTHRCACSYALYTDVIELPEFELVPLEFTLVDESAQ